MFRNTVSSSKKMASQLMTETETKCRKKQGIRQSGDA